MSFASSCTVEVIKTSDELAELGPVWDRLVDRAGLTHPFVTHDWVRTWWECFGGDAELCSLLIRADGEPVAIAPFMRTRERLYGRQVRCLRVLANDHTPRFDFIVAARHEEVYSAIWEYLMKESDDWDMVVLVQVPADSRTVEEFSQRAQKGGVPWGRWRSESSPFVSLGSDWDGFLATLPTKHRSNLRNRMKRLSRLGRVELETVLAGPELEEALQEGLRLEAAAWKEQSGSAIHCDPDVLRFYTLLAQRASRRGWLRLQFLKVGDRRIAFGYCLAYQNCMNLLKPGFDPAYAPYSPGNLLCYHSLRDAFASGFAAYDFLGRDDEWKRQWTNETLTHSWLFLFADRPWARLAHYAKFGVIPVLQKLPAYVRLRDRLFGPATGIRTARQAAPRKPSEPSCSSAPNA